MFLWLCHEIYVGYAAEKESENSMIKLLVEENMLEAIIGGTVSGLAMTGVEVLPVGASRFFTARHSLAVLVGLVGDNSGTMTFNLSEQGMLFLAGRLLDEEQTEVNEENIDAVMELGNMIGGEIKNLLHNTEYQVDKISLPSLVAGQSYTVMYARGIFTVSVEFEITDLPVVRMEDRFFSTSVSLLQGSGR